MFNPERIAKEKPKLTQREMQSVMGLCQGMSNKEMAADRGTSEQVIKNYLRVAYLKMGVSSRSAAIIHAVRQGWVRL